MTNTQTPVAQPAPTHCPICGAGVREKGEKCFDSANHQVAWMYFECGGYMQSWDGGPYTHIAKLKCPEIEKAFEKLHAECERLRAIASRQANYIVAIEKRLSSVSETPNSEAAYMACNQELERLRARIAELEESHQALLSLRSNLAMSVNKETYHALEKFV